MPYKLTRKADEDLTHMFIYGVKQFGLEKATAYFTKIEKSIQIIAQNPRIGRERTEITPPVRIHPSGYHIIIYRIEDDGHILIIRLRHSREDWQAREAP